MNQVDGCDLPDLADQRCDWLVVRNQIPVRLIQRDRLDPFAEQTVQSPHTSTVVHPMNSPITFSFSATGPQHGEIAPADGSAALIACTSSRTSTSSAGLDASAWRVNVASSDTGAESAAVGSLVVRTWYIWIPDILKMRATAFPNCG